MGTRFSNIFDDEPEELEPLTPAEPVAPVTPVEGPTRFNGLFDDEPQPQPPASSATRFRGLFDDEVELEPRAKPLPPERATRTTDLALSPPGASSVNRIIEEQAAGLLPEDREAKVAQVQERIEQVTPSPLGRSIFAGAVGAGASLRSGAQRLFGDAQGAEATLAAESIIQEATARANKETGASTAIVEAAQSATSSLALAGVLRPLKSVGIIAGFTLDAYNRGIFQGKRAGLDEKEAKAFARRSALAEGGVTAVFQLAGLGGFEKLLAKGFKGAGAGGARQVRTAIKDVTRSLLVAGAQELPEENLVEFLQAWNEQVSEVEPNALNFVDKDGKVDASLLGKTKRALQRIGQTSLATAMTVGVAGSVQGAAQIIDAATQSRAEPPTVDPAELPPERPIEPPITEQGPVEPPVIQEGTDVGRTIPESDVETLPPQEPTAPPKGATEPSGDVPSARPAEVQATTRIEDVPEVQRFEAVTPQEDVRVRGRFRVAELDELITSDRAEFDQALQPRDRDTASSREQVAQIAAKPDASRLFESATTDSGAPLVDSRGQVLSGNGRIFGLRGAFEGKRADEFIEATRVKADELGLAIEGFQNPVIVREVLDTAGQSLVRVAELSNRPSGLERTAAEIAQADAKVLLESNLIEKFAPDEAGNIRAASNRQFLQQFINVAGGQNLRNKDGSFSPDIDARVKRAILTAVFQKSKSARDVATTAIENAESLGVKSQLDGIMQSAGRLLKIADAKPDLDIVPILGQATKELIRFKTGATGGETKSIDDFISQKDLFESDLDEDTEIVLRTLAQAKSAKSIRELFDRFAKLADNIDTSEEDLLGPTPKRSAIEVFREAADDEESGIGRQGEIQSSPRRTPEGRQVRKGPATGPGGPRDPVQREARQGQEGGVKSLPTAQTPKKPAKAPQKPPQAPKKAAPAKASKIDDATSKRFSDIGLQAQRVLFERKDGTKEEHLVVKAPRNTALDAAFKSLGTAGFFDDKQTNTGPGWHFVNPSSGLENRILKAIDGADLSKAQPTGRTTRPPEQAKTETSTETQSEINEAIDTDPTEDDPKGFSSRQAELRSERLEKLGLTEVHSPTSQAWAKSNKIAKERNLAAGAFALSNEMIAEPKPLDAIETAGLNQRRVQLITEYDKAKASLARLSDGAAIADKSTEMNRIELEYEAITTAQILVGTEQGRALASRKATIDESLDLLSVTTRARAAKGKDLTGAERKKIKDLVEELERTTAKLESVNKELADLKAAAHMKDGQKSNRLSRMSSKQKDASRDALVNKLIEMSKQGCSV